jgi:hypothetical protein
MKEQGKSEKRTENAEVKKEQQIAISVQPRYV